MKTKLVRPLTLRSPHQREQQLEGKTQVSRAHPPSGDDGATAQGPESYGNPENASQEGHVMGSP